MPHTAHETDLLDEGSAFSRSENAVALRPGQGADVGEAAPSLRPAARRPGWLRDRSGQGLLEYVMLISLIALLMVAVLVVFERTLGGTYGATAELASECILESTADCD